MTGPNTHITGLPASQGADLSIKYIFRNESEISGKIDEGISML